MRRVALSILLSILLVSTIFPQSGRRSPSAKSSTPTAPIQAPLTPDPEPAKASGPPEMLVIPESLRERTIKWLDQSSFRLADFQGKVMVINLWASWCGPCRKEVPEYEKVRKAYQGKAVEFIGLTAEDENSVDKVNKFLREVSFGFRLGWADREMASGLMNGRTTMPQTIVVAGNGRIVSHWTGYSAVQSGKRLKQTIEGALDSPK